MPNLPKEVLFETIEDEGGSWAFDNRLDRSSISNDFYALAVPNRVVANLDDMTKFEEAEFWEMTFGVAAIALRKLNEGASQVREVLVGVNDGVHSGQTVPHTHSHIVGIHEAVDASFEKVGRNFQREIETLRAEFCPAAAAPSATVEISCTLDKIYELSAGIRSARHFLGEASNADSFRIYTKAPLQPGKTDLRMIVDACSHENPQFSVAKAMRVVNNLMPAEELNCDFGFGRFTHFQKMEPVL